jgi:ribonuclease HI
MNTRPQITVWTDGAAKGNPGPAGWAVLKDGELISDWIGHATNNFAELFAILQALEACPPSSEVHVHTDSKLAIGLLSGWRTEHAHLASLVKAIRVTADCKDQKLVLHKTRGHSGIAENEMVDRAAAMQAALYANSIGWS